MTEFSRSRRDALRTGLAGAASLAGLAGCVRPPTAEPTPGPGDPLVAEGFEDGLDPWTIHGAIGPEVPTDEFEWSIQRSREQAHAGEWSLAVFTEGDHDDGTAWATRRLSPPASASAFRVTAQAWSPSESFNTLRDLVLYLGPRPPRSEDDFPPSGANTTGAGATDAGGLREPLHRAEGWTEYAFEWEPAASPEELFLSVGVSVVWEADAVHFVDDVRVDVVEP